jgi:hypothetical protein
MSARLALIAERAQARLEAAAAAARKPAPTDDAVAELAATPAAASLVSPREQMKRLYRQRRQAGLCIKCAAPSQGAARCEDCSRAAANEQRERYAQHKAEGLCVRCKATAEPGTFFCKRHTRRAAAVAAVEPAAGEGAQ